MSTQSKPIAEAPILIEKIRSKKAGNNFPNFIERVRFPRYRNLQANTVLNLDFPITVLVGPNGSGKTSLLHALYGCPGSSNVGNFWFSTNLDPISEGDGKPNCLIYAYRIPKTNRLVEVLKTRITRENNPNYWEPSRPIAAYGMEMNSVAQPGEEEFRSQTRWKALRKNVEYIDFRRTISAYDRFFWLGGPIEPGALEYRKSIIRQRSWHLLHAIESGLKNHFFYRSERIYENIKLSDAEISAASFVLGRTYKEGALLRHSYYGNEVGPTILLKRTGMQYSDAFAGSGETAVFLTVSRVLAAAPGSLILLDEPEVSLHPGAQARLLRFLLNEALKNSHQIIFSTHSPHLIADLPVEAIKLVQETADGKFDVIKVDSARSAFHILEHKPTHEVSVLVEDALSAELIKAAFRELGVVPSGANTPSIHIVPGGSGACLKHVFPSQFVANSFAYLILDGDVFKGEDLPDEKILAGMGKEEMDKVQRNFSGVEGVIPADGGNDKNAKGRSEEKLRDYLRFCRDRVGFLPGAEPEALLFEALIPGEEPPKDIKAYFLEKVRMELGKMPQETISAAEVAIIQNRFVAQILNAAKRPNWWAQILCLARQILDGKPLRPDLEFKLAPNGGTFVDESI